MHSLQVSIFALALSVSLGVQAADNVDRSAERDRSLNAPDCMGLTGADRALCDNEMNNNRTNSKANDSSRINRNRGTNMRDDVRARELNNKDLNTRDLQSIDNKNTDIKPSTTLPSNRPGDIEPNGTPLNSPNTRKSTIDKYKSGNTSNLDVGAGTNNSSTGNTNMDSSNGVKPK